MAIDVRDISYVYMPGTPYERLALSHVSLSCAEGSITAIAGHTGSGKSTLLQHLNGLLAPTSGQVLVDGVDLHPRKPGSEQKKAILEARRKVGMVFQYAENQLFEETIFEDIAFGPRNFGWPEEKVGESVRQAMEAVHLDFEAYRDRSPFALSGGQQRRVALAGVLALRPEYLVLDEPTAGLDPKGRRELLAAIRSLHAQHGTTIIFVSHNMDDIYALADEVVVMSGGRLLCTGSSDEVFSRQPLIEEAGLRPPQIMSFMYSLREACLPLGAQALAVRTAREAAQALAPMLKAGKEDRHAQ